jgi:hypothetical protein
MGPVLLGEAEPVPWGSGEPEPSPSGSGESVPVFLGLGEAESMPWGRIMPPKRTGELVIDDHQSPFLGTLISVPDSSPWAIRKGSVEGSFDCLRVRASEPEGCSP